MLCSVSASQSSEALIKPSKGDPCREKLRANILNDFEFGVKKANDSV